VPARIRPTSGKKLTARGVAVTESPRRMECPS
jgi:hypothetical protein